MKAFLAYPAEPVGLRDTIERAVAIAPKAQIDIRPWPQLEIFGGFIPDEVRAAIDEADVGFFDITIPNPFIPLTHVWNSAIKMA